MIGRELRALVVVLAGIAATGCAHALSQPMPELKGQLALKVVNEQPSTMNDMSLGVYQIPDTSFAGVNILDKKSITVTPADKK